MGNTPSEAIPEPTAESTGQGAGTSIAVTPKEVDPFKDLATLADGFTGLGVSREGPAGDPFAYLAGLTMKEQAATIKALRAELEQTRKDLNGLQRELLAARVSEGKLQERVRLGGNLRHYAHVFIALGTSALTYGLDHWHDPSAGAVPLTIAGAVAMFIGFFGEWLPGFRK